MRIVPSIELLEGRAVRLGWRRREVLDEYGDPVALAERYPEADLFHVVDLEGLAEQEPYQLRLIGQLAQRFPVQVAAGAREPFQVDTLLELGAKAVVVPASVVLEPGRLESLLERWGDKIVVSAEIEGSRVLLGGWTLLSDLSPSNFGRRLFDLGVRRVVCNASWPDGTPNWEALRAFPAELELWAAGGVNSIEQIDSLRDLGGVVVGAALHQGRFTFEEARAIVQGVRS